MPGKPSVPDLLVCWVVLRASASQSGSWHALVGEEIDVGLYFCLYVTYGTQDLNHLWHSSQWGKIQKGNHFLF